MARIGRNQPCPCGSGKKYKKCCYKKNNISQTLLANGFGKNLPKSAVMTTTPQNEKMSEVLLEFAKPLTDECEDDKAFYTALQICVVAWNSSFFSPEERNKLIDESFNKYINDNTDREITKKILSKMLELLDIQISYRDGQQHLNVISSINK
jgi:hypothetical protein